MGKAADSRQRLREVDLEMGKATQEITSLLPRNDHSSVSEAGRYSRVATLTHRISRKLPPVQTGARAPKAFIWKVHPRLRKLNSEAYEPKLVSIGPLHRRKGRLFPMEKVKLEYLQALLNRDEKNSLENYIDRIFGCLFEARDEYSKKLVLSDDDFMEMLVVDGCFIIEFLARHMLQTIRKTALIAEVKSDLLLVENQIPFFVLNELFQETEIPSPGARDGDMDLVSLALLFLEIRLPAEKRPKPCEVLHLLHLQHLCQDPDLIDDEPRQRSCGQLAMLPAKKIIHLISLPFVGLFYLILFCNCTGLFRVAERLKDRKTTPSATELLEAGIKFKRKETPKNYERACQLKVSFRDGTLEIPFFSVDNTTGTRLRNLIFLEQYRNDVKTHFTSYCAFMDDIINTADDVAVLRRSGILENLLSSDSEVAELFNGLCREVFLSFEDHYNAELFKQVGAFCEVPHHRWKANLVQNYFSNPWTFFSVVAAVLILLFSGTQTFLTIFPRK